MWGSWFSIGELRCKALPLVLVLILGFGFGQHFSAEGSGIDTAICNAAYPLVNPYLRCEPASELVKKEYAEFKAQVEAAIGKRRAAGDIKDVSVYFRDLENGPWFGIEPDAPFAPASLMKLPVLIAYYKHAETMPQLLSLKIETGGDVSTEQMLPREESLKAGETYTVDELLRRMIVYSDNNAQKILMSFLSRLSQQDDIFGETLASMGLAKSEGRSDDFLSVKRYASFYRALYNASFLSKEMSQKALDLLTRTVFHEGIDDGVPPEALVAHKYGIRRDGNTVQLHDCGIVYHPRTPYLLCVMTRGDGNDPLAAIIQEVSAMVYNEVHLRH